MTVNALHNMVQDNYDRDELSSFFELTLYHTISWWIDVANDIPLDELPRNLYINKQGMDMYDYLNSVNSYLDFMFQDLDFLHLEEMYSLYKKNPKILEEFLHIDIEQVIYGKNIKEMLYFNMAGIICIPLLIGIINMPCLNVTYKDFHFYKDCPLKLRTSLGFELFTILCIVNYVTVFIEKYFIEEIPQKFKFAYLQYYYLCDFIKEFSVANNIGIGLNSSFKNRGIGYFC